MFSQDRKNRKIMIYTSSISSGNLHQGKRENPMHKLPFGWDEEFLSFRLGLKDNKIIKCFVLQSVELMKILM